MGIKPDLMNTGKVTEWATGTTADMAAGITGECTESMTSHISSK